MQFHLGKKLSILIFVFLLCASLSLAQLSQTGNLSGTVKDSEGMVLPGVVATLKSPALVLPQLSTFTNALGIFRFPSLPPGLYELTCTLEGFNVFVQKDVKVNVGTTVTLNIALQAKTISETITVVGRTPTIDVQKTTKTVNLDAAFLTSVPAPRTLGTYFDMVPGVTGGAAHGSSVRDNTYNLDGVNLTDPTVGTEMVFFGMDIMEEISVQQGGLSAEYGSVRGAVVNVVTKSGGNRLSGSASIYYRHETLQSVNTKGTPLEGSKSGYKYEMEPGITLGGPLIQDKLWFFLNASFGRRDQFVSGYPYDSTENVPADDLRPYPFVKLTFQPNKDNKFSIYYNYSDIRRNHRGASRYQTVATTWKQVTPTHVFNFHWTRFFSSNFFADFRVGYLNSTFNLLAKNDQPQLYEYTNYRRSGSYGYDDLNGRDRLQINLDGTYFVDNLAGTHEFKAGVEGQLSWAYRGVHFNRDPRNGMYQVVTYGGAPWYGTAYADLDEYENMINVSGFLADTWNVSSRLTLNLGLRLDHQRGIIPKQNEAEGPQTLFGYTYNRSVTEALTPQMWTSLSPRFGAVYDITGDGKTLFKVSASRYFMGNISQFVAMANPNYWVVYQAYVKSDWTRGSVFYLSLPGATEIGYGDYPLKPPYLDELTVGIERELFTDVSVSARYIKKWDRDLVEDADANALDLDALLENGELNWTNYTPVSAIDPYNGREVTFWNMSAVIPTKYYLITTPLSNRDYDSVEVTFTKRYSKGWQILASYVWQNSRGLIGTDFDASWGGTGFFDNPNSHVNAVGRFPLERRHQFKLQGLVKGPWGINLSGYYRFLSGGRYTRLVRSQDLGLALNQGDETVNAEERGSLGLPDLSILDLRLEKTIRIKNVSFGIFVDGFNLLNANKATGVQNISSNPSQVFGRMTSIQDPRMFRLGAKFEF